MPSQIIQPSPSSNNGLGEFVQMLVAAQSMKQRQAEFGFEQEKFQQQKDLFPSQLVTSRAAAKRGEFETSDSYLALEFQKLQAGRDAALAQQRQADAATLQLKRTTPSALEANVLRPAEQAARISREVAGTFNERVQGMLGNKRIEQMTNQIAQDKVLAQRAEQTFNTQMAQVLTKSPAAKQYALENFQKDDPLRLLAQKITPEDQAAELGMGLDEVLNRLSLSKDPKIQEMVAQARRDKNSSIKEQLAVKGYQDLSTATMGKVDPQSLDSLRSGIENFLVRFGMSDTRHKDQVMKDQQVIDEKAQKAAARKAAATQPGMGGQIEESGMIDSSKGFDESTKWMAMTDASFQNSFPVGDSKTWTMGKNLTKMFDEAKIDPKSGLAPTPIEFVSVGGFEDPTGEGITKPSNPLGSLQLNLPINAKSNSFGYSRDALSALAATTQVGAQNKLRALQGLRYNEHVGELASLTVGSEDQAKKIEEILSDPKLDKSQTLSFSDWVVKGGYMTQKDVSEILQSRPGGW